MSRKDADLAVLPLPHLFFVLGQYRNANVRELICYFAHTACVCAHRRIGEKHVCCAAAAGDKQLERVCTFKITDTALDQHAEGVGELCGLNVRPPAIRIATEQIQRPRNV